MVTVFLYDSYFKDHPDYDNLTEALSKAQKVIWRLIKRANCLLYFTYRNILVTSLTYKIYYIWQD